MSQPSTTEITVTVKAVFSSGYTVADLMEFGQRCEAQSLVGYTPKVVTDPTGRLLSIEVTGMGRDLR